MKTASSTPGDHSPFKGIIPPLVTPLRERDELDRPGLERLIEHVLSGGVHGIFILGTTGEAPNLSYRLRRQLIDETCKLIRGRVPVLCGITDTAFAESINLACHAADAGVHALVASAPYYFPISQPELADYIERLVTELPLPLLLYNMPMMTKVQFEPKLVRRMMGLNGVVGIKDSSGDMNYLRQILKLAGAVPDWSVLVGPDHLLQEAIHCGAHGGVCGGANIYPRLYVDLYEAASRGDQAREVALTKHISRVAEIYKIGKHASAVVKGIKCSLSLMGVCDEAMAEPFSPFQPPERERVRIALEQIGLLSISK